MTLEILPTLSGLQFPLSKWRDEGIHFDNLLGVLNEVALEKV